MGIGLPRRCAFTRFFMDLSSFQAALSSLASIFACKQNGNWNKPDQMPNTLDTRALKLTNFYIGRSIFLH